MAAASRALLRSSPPLTGLLAAAPDSLAAAVASPAVLGDAADSAFASSDARARLLVGEAESIIMTNPEVGIVS